MESRDSLEDVTDPLAVVMHGGGSWIQELKQHSPKTPIVLVANKVKVENSWVFAYSKCDSLDFVVYFHGFYAVLLQISYGYSSSAFVTFLKGKIAVMLFLSPIPCLFWAFFWPS